MAIIRLRSLGDCVLTTPAIDILKRYRPDLPIGVVVEERFRAIFEGSPDIDEMLPPEAGALRRIQGNDKVREILRKELEKVSAGLSDPATFSEERRALCERTKSSTR